MKKIFFLVSLFFANMVFAQSLTYYKNSKGIYTAQQVDSMLAAMDTRMQERGLTELTSVKEVTGNFKSGDTLFYTFKIKGVNLEVLKKNDQKKKSIIGHPLPAFTYSDINGKTVSASDLKGKPVVLNLWFTTCSPCIKEMPDLNKIRDENPDVIFLAMTYEEKESVSSFLKRIPFNFQHISNAREYVEKLEVGYPTTLFIDKKGIVQEMMFGATLTGLDFTAFNEAFKKIKS